MGFKDVINFSATSDPISGGMKPVLSEHEKHRLQKLSKEMEQDIDDPEFHLDTMGQHLNEDENLNAPKNHQQASEFQMIKEQ